MNASKKVSAGSWIAIVTIVLTIVSYILYSVNIGGEGYFQGAAVPAVSLTWAAVAVLAVAVILSMMSIKSKVLSLVIGLLQIAAPVILAYVLVNLLGGRVEGLGYIYFSNADVAKEVQTAANLSSATMAIASMVAYGISMIAGIIASFTNLKKN